MDPYFPIISIVIPIYNTEKYLKKCLHSVVNQSYKNIEILLINDGSTDNSHMICEKFSENDNRIIYINKENEGVSIARNIGLDNATGNWIYFLDSDDFLDLDTFKDLLDIVKKNNCDIIQFGLRSYKNDKLFRENCPKFFKAYYSNDLKIFIDENPLKPLSACLNFFKKDIIGDIRFDEDLKHCEDMLFVYSVYCNMNQLVSLNKIYYNQVLSENSTSRRPIDKKVIIDYLGFLSKLCEYIRKRELLYEFKDEINNLLKYFFVLLNSYDNYAKEKDEIKILYRKFYKDNKDIICSSFSKVGYINPSYIANLLKIKNRLRKIV